MKVEFDISDEKVQNVSEGGRIDLALHCKKFAEDTVDEASRIEASRRSPNTKTEVTAAIITEAVTYSRRFPAKPRKSIKNKLIQVVAFVSTLITGSLLDTDKFKETSHVIWFIISLGLALGTSVYLIFNSEDHG